MSGFDHLVTVTVHVKFSLFLGLSYVRSFMAATCETIIIIIFFFTTVYEVHFELYLFVVLHVILFQRVFYNGL
jgi:hypothetical protein